MVRLKSTEKDKTGRFVIHSVQLKPRLSCKTLEVNKLFTVTSQSEIIHPFAVQVLSSYFLRSVFSNNNLDIHTCFIHRED